jgi:ribosome-associated heat shock protein Hsp15
MTSLEQPASPQRRAGVRIDKWLWAARFFKTRSLAGRACELGRIDYNGTPAKPAREVHLGGVLKIKTEAAEYEVRVLALSEIRGPAPVARSLYQETEESIEARRKMAEIRRLEPQFEALRAGRPSKRDRRRIDRLRDRY